MKKTIMLMLAVLITSNCVYAESMQDKYDYMYESLRTCSDANIQFTNGSVKIKETTPGICSYVSTFNGKSTDCTMPVSMARKYSIFKTSVYLNEAQVADMQDIEKKYCKTK